MTQDCGEKTGLELGHPLEPLLLTAILKLNQHRIMVMDMQLYPYKTVDVISHPCPNFIGSLAGSFEKLP